MSKQKENDEFGQRIKQYEQSETERRLNTLEPIYARLDGRSFSTFTKDMKKPFDLNLTNTMIEVTKYLVNKTNAKIGYTQSDEISLVWLITVPDGLRNVTDKSSIFFDAKVQKMCSILASMTTAKFISELPYDLHDRLPHFDARVFNLPNKTEAANTILWRAMDAKKNAIQATAQSFFSHKQLQNKDQKQMLEMMKELGIDWDDTLTYPDKFKYGSFIQKRNVKRLLTNEELNKIPEKHRPKGEVIRSEYRIISMPPFNLVKNRVEVIFDGEDPKQEVEHG